MSHRFLTAVLTAASVVFATHAYAEPTTVKGSKSNSSDRMGGGGGVKTPGVAKTTTVKGSKSNTSDRMGGGGGHSGGSAPVGAINLNRNGGRDTPSPGTR